MGDIKLVSRKVLWLAPLLVLAAMACSQGFPPIGRWFFGDSLAMSVLDFKRLQEVRYRDGDKYFVVKPKEPDTEFVAVRLDVRNRRATNFLLNVTEPTFELRTPSLARQEFKGADPFARNTQLDPPQLDPRCSQRLAPELGCPVQFLWGTLELPMGFGVDGWVLFEVPKNVTKFNEMKFDAGDTIFIR